MADLFDPDLARAAVTLILEGQQPPFEGRIGARMTEALWFDSAAALADAGVDYFGPVARKARRRLQGFSKSDVADTTNVVWLDLDPPADADAADAAALVDNAERWLEALKLLGLTPSVFVFSGRGSWAYWKLGRHVPQADAEALMRRLYAQLRPGGSEHDIGRVARMPGSTNEKTGLRAFVMAIDGGRWDPGELARLLPGPDESPGDAKAGDTAPRRVGRARALAPGGRLPKVELPADLAEYVAASPTKREREARGIDGSRLEQAIVAHLVNAGHSDEQIALYFDRHRLPRHEEEKRGRRGYGWLAMSVANAREGMLPPAPSVCIGKGNLFPGEAARGGYGPRETGWPARRWVILREMPDGPRKLELVEWAKKRFSIERSQVRRELGWLEEKRYIGAVADERDRRIKRVHRTEAGRSRLETWGGMGTPFEFRKGRLDPTRQAAAEAPAPEPARDPEPTPVPTPSLAKPARSSINEELATDRAESLRRERSLIDDVHRIHIPGVRWTHLQLVTPLDGWVKVRLHEQLRVAYDDGGFPVFRSFVSPKDPSLGGPEADDPIEERTLRDGGYPARDRWIGAAAELTETAEGFVLATRTENGAELPNVGLLVQSERNFYEQLLVSRVVSS